MKPELEFHLLTRGKQLPAISWQIDDIEPLLTFLYNLWWRVDFEGLDNFPVADGPALIVGNVGGMLPWPALMLVYALSQSGTANRPVHTLVDLDWLDNQTLIDSISRAGIEPWSTGRLEELMSLGEVAVVFPEGVPGLTKPHSMRNRLQEFDPGTIAPAFKHHVPLIPLVTLGCDDAVPVLGNITSLAKLLGLPALPVTPFFPWLPFPFSLIASLPVRWHMRLLEPVDKPAAGYFLNKERSPEEHMANLLSGTIQAELNRLIRQFSHSLI